MVNRVELRIRVGRTKTHGVFAQRPDGIARGRQAVLKDTRVGRLSFSIWPDVEDRCGNTFRLVASVHVVNGHTRKVC